MEPPQTLHPKKKHTKTKRIMKLAIALLAVIAVTAYATPAVKVDLLPGLEKALLGNIKAQAKCDYEDPFKSDACNAGEANVTISGVPGAFCAPKCDASGSCPTNTCPLTVAKPQCVLQDQSGDKYCALLCTPGGSGAQCSHDEHMVCTAISGVGLCTYLS